MEGAFLSLYFRQEPFRGSLASSVSLSFLLLLLLLLLLLRELLPPAKRGERFSGWRGRGWFVSGRVYDERKRYAAEGKEKLEAEGGLGGPARKMAGKMEGSLSIMPGSLGFPLRFEELPYRSSKNGTSDHAEISSCLCQAL